MSFGNKKVTKGVVIRQENTLTPAELEINAGGTASTKTTVVGSQTTNKTITLPDATTTLLGTNNTAAVTNKTIVVASNTVTTAASGNLTSTELNAALDELQDDIDLTNSNLATHIADTTTHGTTGDIVGTTDAQPITGKTILEVDNIRIDLNTISSLNTDGNIILDPNGNGNINLTAGGTGLVNIGSSSFNANASGSVNITGDLDVDNLNLNGNTISATNADGNIILSPIGLGAVLPDSASRELGNAANGWLLSSNSIALTTPAGSARLSMQSNPVLPSTVQYPSLLNNSTSSVASIRSLGIFTETSAVADANQTGNINIESGNKTAGTGASGSINLITGTSSGGTRGSINHTALSHVFNGIMLNPAQVDVSTTGAGASISSLTSSFIKVANAGLTSINNITNLTLSGQHLVLTNNTGNILTIVNDSGGSANNRILTGTGADITMADGTSHWLIYDSGTSRWRVINASSGGGGGGANTTLSNLGVTSLNANLLPSSDGGRDLGSSTLSFNNIYGRILRVDNSSGTETILVTGAGAAGNGAAPSNVPQIIGTTSTGANETLILSTVDNAVNNSNTTGGISFYTGHKTAGSGNSGNITLQTGTSSGGTRGQVTISANKLQMSGAPIEGVANPTNAQDAATKAYVDANGARSKNYLQNAEMRMTQRFGTNVGTVNNDVYGLDRWYALGQNATTTAAISRQTEVSASITSRYHQKITQANATPGRFGIAQIISSANCFDLIGETVNFSFFAKTTSSEITTIRAAIIYWQGTADTVTSNFVTSWAATPTLDASASFANTPADITITNSWAQYTVSTTLIDLPSTFNNLMVFIWTPNTEAQNDDLFITQCQLTLGSTPANWPLISKSYEQDLAECQAYYEKSYNTDLLPGSVSSLGAEFMKANGTAHIQGVRFRVNKRTGSTPTITLLNPNSGAAGSWRDTTAGTDKTVSAGNQGETGFQVSVTSSVDGNNMSGHWTAEAEL